MIFRRQRDSKETTASGARSRSSARWFTINSAETHVRFGPKLENSKTFTKQVEKNNMTAFSIFGETVWTGERGESGEGEGCLCKHGH